MTTRPEIALPEPAQPPSNFTSRRAARLARERAGLAASTSTTRSPRPVTLTPAPCEPATTQTPTSP